MGSQRLHADPHARGALVTYPLYLPYSNDWTPTGGLTVPTSDLPAPTSDELSWQTSDSLVVE